MALIIIQKEYLFEREYIEYIRKDIFIKQTYAFLKDRIEHDSIDYPMATEHLIDDYIKYMKEKKNRTMDKDLTFVKKTQFSINNVIIAH